MRRAIGATDGRLFRQLFTQSALLGALGGGVGLLTAVPGVGLLVALLPPERAARGRDSSGRAGAVGRERHRGGRDRRVRLGRGDPRAPRRRALPDPPAATPATTARRRGPAAARSWWSRSRWDWRSALMALLMVRSFVALRAVDLGFTSDGVTIARVALPGDRYASPASQRAFFAALLERVRALPGVESAGIVSARPVRWTRSGHHRERSAQAAAARRDWRRSPTCGSPTPASSTRSRWPRRAGPFSPTRTLPGLLRPSSAKASPTRCGPGEDPVGRDLAIVLNGGITATDRRRGRRPSSDGCAHAGASRRVSVGLALSGRATRSRRPRRADRPNRWSRRCVPRLRRSNRRCRCIR